MVVSYRTQKRNELPLRAGKNTTTNVFAGERNTARFILRREHATKAQKNGPLNTPFSSMVVETKCTWPISFVRIVLISFNNPETIVVDGDDLFATIE